MALSSFLAAFYIFASFFCQFGNAEQAVYPPKLAAPGILAEEYIPGEQGASNQQYPETGNPDHLISEALLCFNEKQIYSSCDEDYRLSQKGELNVPPESTDQYCNGPCVSETNLVLSCIESLFHNFKFLNQATIDNVRETIKSGCAHGPERGDFNVAEHVQDESSSALKAQTSVLLCGLVFVLMGRRLMLWPMMHVVSCIY